MDTRVVIDPEDYKMPWRIKNGYFFLAKPLIINADIETVWKEVLNISNYQHYSKGAITAYIDGKPAEKKPLTMILYKDEVLGKFIPESTEKIHLIKDKPNKKVIGWERGFFANGTTERYHVLKKKGDKTISAIGLRIPDAIGFFVNLALQKQVVNGFNQLNEGIKEEVEHKKQFAN